ncbi:hypothetical protein QI230_02890 [Staphylococcus saprophyticus]|nr:hypothetical protein [Staphylococcus saprophyticus]
MVKIKSKKQMNLPQLIEWGFNNPNLVKGKLFLTKEHDEYSPYVQFSVDGYGVRTSQSISNDDTFTVEVEEEINRETEFEHLIEVTKDELHIHWSDSSVAGQMMPVSQEFHAYIDGKYELIWTHEKGLVEQ